MYNFTSGIVKLCLGGLTMNIKYRIRDLRCEADISQQKLADALGVTRGAVAQWENGFTLPATDMLEKICDYFNCSLDYLMGRTNIKHSADEIFSNDFLIAFDKLSEELSEDDKKVILRMAQGFANSNEASKKKNNK